MVYKKLSLIASAAVWILLPKCSACFAAYMGLFSALGLGHLLNHSYTLTIIKIVLGINIFASLFLALRERQYSYAIISFTCAIIFIVNKIYFGSLLVNIVAGIILIIAALRIRMLRINQRKCAFHDEDKAAC